MLIVVEVEYIIIVVINVPAQNYILFLCCSSKTVGGTYNGKHRKFGTAGY